MGELRTYLSPMQAGQVSRMDTESLLHSEFSML